MNEGHIFLVLGFDGNWPPPERRPFAVLPHGGAQISIFALPDGRLEFLLQESSLTLIRHFTKPIKLEGSGMFLFDAGWKDGTVDIRLNREMVPSRVETASPFVVTLKEHEGRGELSLTSGDAIPACQKWTDWRSERYGKAKTVDSPHLRAKSFDEQALELRNAISALSHHLEEFSKGKTFLIVDIATSLRALVYWEDGKGSKYNPLLLRIAGRLSPPLPLPVYAFTNPDAYIPDIVPQASSQSENAWPSLYREFPGQRLVDIQEALDSDIQTEREGSFLIESSSERPRILRSRDLIREFASTSASGHYHEHVKRDFDRMQKTEVLEVPISNLFIIRIGSIVVELGEFVLQHLCPPLVTKVIDAKKF